MLAFMRAALVQRRCRLGDKQRNLEAMARAIMSVEADLYVFPELFLTGYMVRDEAHRLAEALDGPSVDAVRMMAAERGACILFGMARRDGNVDGILRNSAVLVRPDGGADAYDKSRPANFGPFEEGLYFGGGSPVKPFNVNGTKIGVEICYDLFFPEISAAYAREGADVIVTLSASPITSRAMFEAIAPARAIETTAYVVYVNQVGSQLNQVFFGGGMCYGPRGDRVAKLRYFQEDTAVVDVLPEEVRAARRLRPTIRDGL